LTVPSASWPARRKECAIVERAYPSTSPGWHKMHRFDPVGALDILRAEVCASPLAPTRRTDGFWPEHTLDTRARKAKRGVRGFIATARHARRSMRKFDSKAGFSILTIRQKQVLPSRVWVPQENLALGGQLSAVSCATPAPARREQTLALRSKSPRLAH